MRKLKSLAISTLTTAILTLMLAACGGDPPLEQNQEPTTQSSQANLPTIPPTHTLEPLPTRPSRLTNLGTPTRNPDDSKKDTTSEPTTAPKPPTQSESTTGLQEPTPEDTPIPVVSPESLIPTNPKTNDTILLQDIYDRMDLDQFALDPNEPIERFGAQKNSMARGPSLQDKTSTEPPIRIPLPSPEGSCKTGCRINPHRRGVPILPIPGTLPARRDRQVPRDRPDHSLHLPPLGRNI